jgi:hypothetical protein
MAYTAYGSTYTATGWTPVGPIYDFAPGDLTMDTLQGWAERCRRPGVGGAATYGCERIDFILPSTRRRAEVRTAAVAGIGRRLESAPNGAHWTIRHVADTGVTLEYTGRDACAPKFVDITGEPDYRRGDIVSLAWTDLRYAAAEAPSPAREWYAALLSSI